MRIDVLRVLGLLLTLSYAASSSAATAFKCVAVDGSVAFQDQPCPPDVTETRVRLAAEGAAPVPSAAPPPPVAASGAPAAAAAVAPRRPLPALFSCERPDGSRYTSTTGIPAQHLVPLWALGYPPRSLSDAYGGTRRQRMQRADPSTPTGAVTASNAAIAGMSAWVEEQCLRLDHRQTCAHFRAEYDRVHKVRRNAKASRAQLEMEEHSLEAMLRDNC